MNRKHSKTRREEKMLKKVKMDAPGVYNSKADLDAFDRWGFEVKTWKRLNKLSNVFAITILNKHVTEKAGIFYMKYVAERKKQWDLPRLFKGLFGYCFPKDYKSNLRRRLMSVTQGKTQITEFVRDIERMAGRFPDVNKRGLIEIFWWGINPQIHVDIVWMEGNTEKYSMKKLVDYAVKAEDSIEFLRQKEGRTWGRFANNQSPISSKEIRSRPRCLKGEIALEPTQLLPNQGPKPINPRTGLTCKEGEEVGPRKEGPTPSGRQVLPM